MHQIQGKPPMFKRCVFWVVYLSIFALALCLVLAFCAEIDPKITAWQTRRHLGGKNDYYHGVIASLPIAEDQLMADTVTGLYVPDAAPECIAGIGARLYGSYSSYGAIAEQYRDRLEATGWVYSGSGTNGSRVNYHNALDTMAVSVYPSSEKEFGQRASLSGVSRTALALWSSEYETLYGITFLYFEPDSGCLLY
jgi:hypothetical protein